MSQSSLNSASSIRHGGSTAVFATGTAPAPQVDAQLDSASFSMEALESTVTNLINRLDPVTGDGYYEESMQPSESPTMGSTLVPVAARICYLENRIRNVEARLSRALNALQI